MHAFLIISQNSNFQSQIEHLGKKLKAKILEFPLSKIEDVRNLNNLMRLSFNEPTLVVCEKIHEATEEALNAFLKNLEEPQENLYFALTAPSTRKVLPTIVSRCQVIKISNFQFPISNLEQAQKFLRLTTGERLAFVDKIRDRGEAQRFVEDIINSMHNLLHSNEVNHKNVGQNLEVATQTLGALKANGNVSLQLTNMVISLV